jgi:ubiquinone/menaquinone biosynthesis C-methylase UbiE
MDTNISKVSQAFSAQAPEFDRLSAENGISLYLREVFREEVCQHLPPNAEILELNCGTGIDALYFAGKGHSVLATDNAPGMLAELDKKISRDGIGNITTARCSYHHLDKLNAGKFDHIISNFGGLNCTADIEDVLSQFSSLLKENGRVTLMIMPKICPWEIAMLLRGKFRTAFRRFGKSARAHIEGVHFDCYYYNPGTVIRKLKKDFTVQTLKGVCITVPPEFYTGFEERYPRLFAVLRKIDSKISGIFPFTHCCDHFMITLQKKQRHEG